MEEEPRAGEEPPPHRGVQHQLQEEDEADGAFLILMLGLVQSGRADGTWKYTVGSPSDIPTPTTLVVVSEYPDSRVKFAMGIIIAPMKGRRYRSVTDVASCVECGGQWPMLEGLGVAWATNDRSLAWWSNRGKLRCACCSVSSWTETPRSFVVVPEHSMRDL